MALTKVLFVRITMLEYNNIPEKDPNTLYYITDIGRVYRGDMLQAEEGPVKSINGKTGDVVPDILDINGLQANLLVKETDINTLKTGLESFQTLTLGRLASLDSLTSGHSTNITNLLTNVSTNTTNITGIQEKIPVAATSANQLADKEYVNSSINSLSANYVTYDIDGDPFPTKNDLTTATIFYKGGQVYTPTKTDYCLVFQDESAPVPFNNGQVRYVYDGSQWDFQYGVNESPLTAAQLAALNSGATNVLISRISELDGKVNTNQGNDKAGLFLKVNATGSVETNNINFSDIKGNINGNTTLDTAFNNKADKSWIESIYPVGSIYTTTIGTFDPNALTDSNGNRVFPGGWSRFGAGRVLIGAGSITINEQAAAGNGVTSVQNTYTYTGGQMGGEVKHGISYDEMPSHDHIMAAPTGGAATFMSTANVINQANLNATVQHTSDTGGGALHNNMQPYIVVYFWNRVS